MKNTYLLLLICFFILKVPLILFSQIDTIQIKENSFVIERTTDSIFITNLNNSSNVSYELGTKFLVEDTRDFSRSYRDVSFQEKHTNVMLLGSTFGTMGAFYDKETKDTIQLLLYDMLNIDRMENEFGISMKPLKKISFSYPDGIDYIVIPLFYTDEYDFYQKDYLKVYSDLFYTIFRDVLLIDLRNDKNTVRLLSDLRSLLKTKKQN